MSNTCEGCDGQGTISIETDPHDSSKDYDKTCDMCGGSGVEKD